MNPVFKKPQFIPDEQPIASVAEILVLRYLSVGAKPLVNSMPNHQAPAEPFVRSHSNLTKSITENAD